MRIGFLVERFKVRLAIWCCVGRSTSAFQENIIVYLQYLFASELANNAGIPILKTKKWTSFLAQPRTWRVWASRSTKIHSTDLHCTQQGMYQKSCWTNLQSSMQDYAFIIDGGRAPNQKGTYGKLDLPVETAMLLLEKGLFIEPKTGNN